jgi:hypothetical protein
MPFITTASTDTNIVALFSAITYVSYTYNTKEVEMSFDIGLDSTNAPVQKTTIYGNGALDAYVIVNGVVLA